GRHSPRRARRYICRPPRAAPRRVVALSDPPAAPLPEGGRQRRVGEEADDLRRPLLLRAGEQTGLSLTHDLQVRSDRRADNRQPCRMVLQDLEAALSLREGPFVERHQTEIEFHEVL